MKKVIMIFSALLAFIISSFSIAGKNCPQLGDYECTCENFPGFCITTGSKEFTYFKIGKNLEDFVAPDAKINLAAVEGGSIDNIKKMRWQHGVKFAIVQSDVLTFYKREQKKGNKAAQSLISPLRVVLPLYNEEVHVITSTSSGINSFSDLKGKKIALGSSGGGSALSGLAIYELAFGEEMSDKNTIYTDSFDESLKLVIDGKADAWIMTVGQPAGKFAQLPASASKYIKIVPFNFNDQNISNIINSGPYYKATIKSSSYPWISKDIETPSVKAFLITQEYNKKGTKQKIMNFTQSLCLNFDNLQKNGHPKWKEVKLEYSELPGGWKYSDDVVDAFGSKHCGLAKAEPTCSEQYKVLNLCQ